MTTVYQVGDRVELVTDGGFPICRPGLQGHVTEIRSERLVRVRVDGVIGWNQGLNFFLDEIKPVANKPRQKDFECRDHYGDKMVFEVDSGAHGLAVAITTYSQSDRITGHYVLNKEQALQLAATIKEVL